MPSCSQPNCRIAETGVCLEGHAGECPHRRDNEIHSEAPASEVQASNEVVFHTGEKLTVDDATLVLQERGARVIFAAGGRDSGKTTFLARIGELFRSGKFREYQFSGSLSLWAFERATWKATVPSGGGVPSTERTYRVENDMFYHLSVKQESFPAKRFDLLISDLAGETFPTILGSADFARGLSALGRCDTLVLFLDSARLARRGEQQAEWDNATGFLQRVYPRDLSVRVVNLQVVFSRWDYVQSADAADSHILFCMKIENDIRTRFQHRFSSVSFHRIAARPKIVAGTTSDDEIQRMFSAWCEASTAPLVPPLVRPSQAARDFSLFNVR